MFVGVTLKSILSSVLGTGKETRRRHTRVVPLEGERIEVRVEGVDFQELLYAQDISEGGIGVIVPSGFKGRDLSEAVEVLIKLPNHAPFQTTARVRHLSSKSNQNASLFGLQFEDLSEDGKNKIGAYVRARMPRVRIGGGPSR